MSCVLLAEDCGADHIAPVLRLRCTHPGQWSGTCPVCQGERKLSLATGTNGRRFIWTCHRRPACPSAAIHEAILATGVSSECLGSARGKHRKPESVPRSVLTDLAYAKLPASAYQLRLLMLGEDLTAQEAAAKLGMPERTYYRAVTALPKMAENRRS